VFICTNESLICAPFIPSETGKQGGYVAFYCFLIDQRHSGFVFFVVNATIHIISEHFLTTKPHERGNS